MPILFLSHSGADADAARALKKLIEQSPAAKKYGLKVWFDKDDLRAGKSWQAQLAETIEKEADAFAVLLGAKGVLNWVEAEVEVALSRAATCAFPFIPIIAKESRGSNALPAFARRYQGVLDPLNEPGELAKLIEAATGNWDQKIILTDEPFVGLRAMDESWANRFFGRKDEVGALVEKFKKHRLIAIVADSGAGKSSLAQAGFVPAFRGGALADPSREEPDDKIWHVVVMRPGGDPVQGLKDGIADAAELLGLDGGEQAKLRGRINIAYPGESVYALRCDLDRRQTETLLIIDQFEELLIQTPEDKRAPFADFLCALADSAFGVRILLTLRADYFNLDDSLAKLRSRLWADGQDAVFRLRRMSGEALAQTAREPLALAGFKDRPQVEALIQSLQRDVSDREGDLALVQMALHSVWRRHKTQSEDLLQAYAEVQGISGALAYEAEKVRCKLSAAQQALLFPILARLIRRGELGGATRRMAQREEFDTEKQKLIAHLSSEDGGRLLLTGERSVEIAHEALITQWPWLRKLTAERNFGLEIDQLARLMEKAKAWAKESTERRPRYLATGAELETFAALAERRQDWLSATEREFLVACRARETAEQEREEQRRKRELEEARKLAKAQEKVAQRTGIGLIVACVLLVGALGAAWFGFNQAQLARKQTAVAEQSTKEAKANFSSALTALALTESEDQPVDAAKLALAAWPRPGAMDLPKRDVTANALSRSLVGLYEHMRINTDSAVRSVAFSPDGARILAGSKDTARVWDAAMGKEIRAFEGHEGAVRAVAFSPDGKRVLTGSEDKTARMWDAATGKELRAFVGHKGSVTSVAFSPDGKRVLTGSEDKTARMWDAATGKELRAFKEVNCVAFSPDGGRVLTGSDDGTAWLCDAAMGKQIRAFKGLEGIGSVAFSPDGGRVLTANIDTVRLWDAAKGKELLAFKGRNDFSISSIITSAAFSPDGARVLTGSFDKKARLWDAATGRQIRAFAGHEGAVFSLAFSPDGKRVLTGSVDKTIRLWDAGMANEIRAFEGHERAVWAVAFSHDGKRVLTGSNDKTARMWDAATGKQIHTFVGHKGDVTSVAFSPDGKRVLTGSEDKTARIWDAATGKAIRAFEGHAGQVRSAAFSPDGAHVLTGSYDMTARLWDAATGKEIHVFKGHESSLFSVAFSPDGARVVTGSGDETARLWDTATGKEIRVFKGHERDIFSVAFSPDGASVVTGSGDRTARLWDTATGKQIRTLKHEEGIVHSVAFSPDGKRVLTGSSDETIYLWDAATGKEIRAFEGNAFPGSSIAFSPDGARVLLGSNRHNAAHLWDISSIPPGSIFDIACALLPDHDLSGLGKDYGLDLSRESPICQTDASGKFNTPLPDLPATK
jgi:WD40 repeat protein